MGTLLFPCALTGGCGTLQHQKIQQAASEARALTYDGLNALERGHPQRANDLFIQAEKLNPNDHRIREHHAASLAELGQIDQAIAQLQQALEATNEPRLHVQLGELYLQKLQPQQAEAHLRLAIQGERRNSQAWKLLGKSQVAQQRFDESLKSFHRAASYSADDMDIQLLIAQVYYSLDQSSRSLSVLEAMRQNFPPDREPPSMVELEGQVLLSMSQPERAVVRLAGLSERSDLSHSGYLALCQAYRDSGDLSNARLTAATAAEKFPDDRGILGFIAELPSGTADELVIHR